MRWCSLFIGLLAILLACQELSLLWSDAQAQEAPTLPPPEPLEPKRETKDKAQANDKPAPASEQEAPKDDGLVDIHFSELTEIRDIAQFIARLTGKNIILDQQIRGQVRIIAPEMVTKEEAYQAFLSALNVLGLTTVETGKVIKVMRIREAMRSNLETFQTLPEGKITDQLITQVIPLKYISATRIRAVLSRFITPGSIVAYRETNTLIISDTGFNIEKILDIISLMDVKTQQPKAVILPIKYGLAKELAEKVKEFLKVANAKKRRSTNHNYEVVVDERSNSVVLVGPPAVINNYRRLVKQLDIPSKDPEAGARIHVRPLEYADAKKLAVTLSSLSSSARRRQRGSQNVEGPSLKITADEASNSILIAGSRSAYHAVNQVIRRLDVRKSQIFIEANVLDISADSGFRYGTSVLAGYGTPDGSGTKWITGWQAGGLAPLVIASSDAGQGTPNVAQAKEVAGVLSEGVSIGVLAPQGVQVPGLGKVSPGALLKLIKADSDTRILSSPYILTVDNEEASLTVGETLFFKTSLTDALGVASETVQKENVDFTMTVKPNVNHSNYLSLKLKLDANAVISLDPSGMPRLSKRKVSQVVNLKEGQTVVIAGLTKIEQHTAKQRIPLLGDIPILGALFRTEIRQDKRSQLAIFLTPYVVHGASDLARIYRKKLEETQQFMGSVYGAKAKEDDFSSELPDIEDGLYRESPSDRQDEERLRQRRQEALKNWGYTEQENE